MLELLDGNDILKKLMLKANKVAGEKKREKIFNKILLPQLGTFSVDKPKMTQKFMENLEAELTQEEMQGSAIERTSCRSKEEYLSERKDFLKSESIDDFL